MEPSRSILGVGPRIAVFMLPFVVAAAAVTIGWHDAVRIPFLHRSAALGAGAVLLVPGIALYVGAARALVRDFEAGKLITTGAYGLCRNPLYGAFILFLVPALGLLLDSWPIVMLSFAMYGGFKLFIGREYLELAKTFGAEYARYEASVNELWPAPRGRDLRHAPHGV